MSFQFEQSSTAGLSEKNLKEYNNNKAKQHKRNKRSRQNLPKKTPLVDDVVEDVDTPEVTPATSNRSKAEPSPLKRLSSGLINLLSPSSAEEEVEEVILDKENEAPSPMKKLTSYITSPFKPAAEEPLAETFPERRVLEQSYCFVKNVYSATKKIHKITTKLGNVMEKVSNKTLEVAANLNENVPVSLKEIDLKLTPTLVKTDLALDPIIHKALTQANETKKKTEVVLRTTEKLQPVLRVARKVLPVETSARLAKWLFTTLYSHYDLITVAGERKLEQTQ